MKAILLILLLLIPLPTFATQMGCLPLIETLRLFLDLKVDEIIDTGYVAVDKTAVAFDLNGKKFRGYFESREANPTYADTTTVKGRGAFSFWVAVESPEQAIEVYALLMDSFLSQKKVFRGSYYPEYMLRAKPVRKLEIGVTGESRGDLTYENGKEQSSNWVGGFFSEINSSIDMDAKLLTSRNAGIDHPEKFDRLKIKKGENLLIIVPHIGRYESENSERFFRALMAIGIRPL